MLYNLFDGGDGLAYPSNTMQSKFSGGYVPLPAEHHKRRELVLEWFRDTSSRAWRGDYAGLSGQGDKPLQIMDGDKFTTHLAGAGALLREVVVHVKGPGVGGLEPIIRLSDGSTLPVTPLGSAADLLDPATGLAKPGFYRFEVEHGDDPLMDAAFLEWSYIGAEIDPDTGEKSVMDACIAVFLALTDYYTEHECDCVPIPCETEYPPAECSFPRSSE